MDYALVNLAVTLALLVATFAFRKRILKALGRLLLHGAIQYVHGAFLTEEVSEAEDGTRVRKIGLSVQGKAILGAVAPALFAELMKNVKIALPKFAPINPATGQLDFMAPILAKAADGKKINLNDFLPLLIEKGLPMIQGFLGGMGNAAKPPGTKTEPNPFIKELQP